MPEPSEGKYTNMSTNYEDREGGFERDYELERSVRAGKGAERGGRRIYRRRVCRLCVEKVDLIDFKDVKLLQSYVPERGKILPRRISGVCAAHQRMLGEAIKRARSIALLPFTTD